MLEQQAEASSAPTAIPAVSSHPNRWPFSKFSRGAAASDGAWRPRSLSSICSNLEADRGSLHDCHVASMREAAADARRYCSLWFAARRYAITVTAQQGSGKR